jgi:hypothetical protein
MLTDLDRATPYSFRVGQNRISAWYMTYDPMYGNFLAKNTVCTPYIPINVWFWPTLDSLHVKQQAERVCAKTAVVLKMPARNVHALWIQTYVLRYVNV